MVPRELWNTLGAAGLLCPDMPEEYGAAGTTPQVTFAIIEEASRMGFGGVATGYGIHSNIVAPYINHFGTDEQKEHWLPKMVSGEAVGALAMTEPGAGSDVQGIRTNAVKDGDEWILNGSKIFITNGYHADVVIVAAITDPGKGAKGTSLFLVDTSLPGFQKGKKLEKIGQHTSDTAELFFQDVRLPASALLGELNKGFVIMMQELPRERLGIAAQAVSAAEGALDITVDYVLERKAFGQTVASFQNTRFVLAEVKTEIAINRAFYEKCADAYALRATSARRKRRCSSTPAPRCSARPSTSACSCLAAMATPPSTPSRASTPTRASSASTAAPRKSCGNSWPARCWAGKRSTLPGCGSRSARQSHQRQHRQQEETRGHRNYRQ